MFKIQKSRSCNRFGTASCACTTPAPAEAPIVEVPAPTKSPVTLTMLFAQSLLGGVEQEITTEFSKIHPEVTFKIEAVPDGGYFDLLRANITTGNMPDLFQTNIGHVSTALIDEAGFAFDHTGMESLKLYHSSLVEASKFNGKVVNFSLGVGVLGLPYNKAVLAKYGYSEPLKSWQEMMEAGAKLKKRWQRFTSLFVQVGNCYAQCVSLDFQQSGIERCRFQKGIFSQYH